MSDVSVQALIEKWQAYKKSIQDLWKERPTLREGSPYSNYITSEVIDWFEKAEKVLGVEVKE